MTTAVTTAEFSEFCGPLALAAIAGLSPTEVAATIRGLQKTRGELATGPSAEISTLVATLEALGFAVSPWLTPEIPEARRPTVAQLARVPGTWLLATHGDGGGGGGGHALAARDGQLIAGDPRDRYADRPVRWAYAVEEPPRNIPRGTRRAARSPLEQRTCSECGGTFVITPGAPAHLCPFCCFNHTETLRRIR